MAAFKIAITGAGPAGCTLASVLIRHGYTVSIYEAEASLHARSQGGTLDLRIDGGLYALKKANLYEDFEKYARYDGEALKITDKNLRVWLKAEQGTKKNVTRPEIDREQLRQMLFDSLPANTVQWNHKVRRVDCREGAHFVCFADGTEAGPFDMVVGADGAFSKVRAAVTDVKPMYTGCSYLAGRIPEPEKNNPELYRLVNRGSVFAYSDNKSISIQQLADGYFHTGLVRVCPEEWLATVDMEDVDSVRTELKQTFADWDPLVRSVIDDVDADSLQKRGLYMLPIGHRWQHQAGITLIGDAAHLMAPFAGEGVNLAMRDAVNLAKAITNAKDAKELDEGVQSFEEDMFVYATKKQQITWENMTDMLLTPGAPRARIGEWVGRMAAEQIPSPYLRPVARGMAKLYFAGVKLVH